MALRNLLTDDKRERLAAAKAEIAEILAPVTEAERKARKEARRAMVKRVGKRASGQRQPRVKENAYLAFIRRHPCEVCGATRRIEAAHVRSGYADAGWRPTGMQEKPDDRRTLPLCADHHREGPKAQHAARERDWWASHGIYPPDRCAVLSAEYDGLNPMGDE